MKKLISLALALVLMLSACALADAVNVAALNGPTGMGMVKLMKDEENGEKYTFTLAGAPDMIAPRLVKGELDIACVPANLASVLYNNTNGKLAVLAVNTLGVLYIVERGETVNTIADLKGRTVYAAGQGSTPEYALRFLLTQNGIDPDKDVDIRWKSEHAECLTALIGDASGLAMLPQPFVTVAQTKKDDIRIAVDMTEEWESLETDSRMVTGVVVARKAWLQENPEAADAFLSKRRIREREYIRSRRPDRRIRDRSCRRCRKSAAVLQYSVHNRRRNEGAAERLSERAVCAGSRFRRRQCPG